MNYFKKQLARLEHRIATEIICVLESRINQQDRMINGRITQLENAITVKNKLPAFATITSPEGIQGVSNIIWLAPGDKAELEIIPYSNFPISSIISCDSPFLMEYIRVGNVMQLATENQKCKMIRTNIDFYIGMKTRCIISYPNDIIK